MLLKYKEGTVFIFILFNEQENNLALAVTTNYSENKQRSK